VKYGLVVAGLLLAAQILRLAFTMAGGSIS